MKLYWIRHLPVEQTGCYLGQMDVEAQVPPGPPRPIMPLPDKALWFSSPLRRAEATAKWLMALHVLPLHKVPELKEQHFGAWEGCSYQSVWRDSCDDYDWSNPAALKPVGGESFIELCERIDRWLGWLLEEHIEQPVIAVAHAGVIRAGLRHVLDLKPSQALAMQVDYASVTHVTYHPEGSCVHYVNVPVMPAAAPR